MQAVTFSCCFMAFLLHGIEGLSLNLESGQAEMINLESAGDSYITLSESSYNQFDEADELHHRARRQIPSTMKYLGPVGSEVHAGQHCNGIYLRWKRPPDPISSAPYTNSEFQYYNIYRKGGYFTSVEGMTPYASGKDIAELRQLDSVSWFDPDPLTNDAVWYAVTMVTRSGKERKDVTVGKAMYIGAFGGVGSRVALTSAQMKGNTMHHAAIFNPDRNEYFVAWDVDINVDGQPDKIYAVRLNSDGNIIGSNILDASVNIKGTQGWPSVTYNPKSNEYLIVFQLSSLSLFGGRSLIIAQRIRVSSFTRATNPNLLMKANANQNGRTLPVPVVKPHVIYNALTGGYVTMAEVIALDNRHGILMAVSDATAAASKISVAFPTPTNARSGRVFYDTRRNQLFLVAQIPHKSVNKKGDTVPKLPYAFIVTKRNATGAAFQAVPTNMLGGETSLLDPSLSGFYDSGKDRLMLFWSDLVKGKRVLKSSRVILTNTGDRGVEFMDDNQRELCSNPASAKNPYAAQFTASGGQVVVWQESMSGKQVVAGSLMRSGAFQFSGREQKRPIVVANNKLEDFIVIWQEVINARQTNLFVRKLRAVTHRCMSCNAPRVCIRDGQCVLPFKEKNPCGRKNGGCSQICLKSYTGAKCACREGYKLNNDKKSCTAQGQRSVLNTMLLTSLNEIWKVTTFSDGSKKLDRIPYLGMSLVAISYDTKNKMLYWSDVGASTINRGKLDGTKAEVFVSNVDADGLVIDSVAGLVYWTDFKNKRIEVMGTNKQNRRVLVSSGLDKPRAISICKIKGTSYIYWSDWGTPQKIERLRLDNTGYGPLNRRMIVSYGLGWPNGIFADCKNGKLFWADAQYDKIEVSDLMGRNRRSLAGVSVVHPYALYASGKSIYWTDWSGSILKADKNTGLNQVQEITTLQRPSGLFIIEGQVESKKICADPGVPKNGVRKGNDFSEDSTIIFECKSGYKIFGDAQIRCKATGKWTERTPLCIEIRCRDPGKPDYGNRVLAGTSVGDGVDYTCNPGYKLIGKRVRVCQPGGKWAGSQPSCVSLPVFVTTPNNETLSFGKTVILKCDAHADTSVKISWLKDGKPFIVKDTETRIFKFRTSIFISNTRFSDSGIFTCQATNEAGTIQAHAQLRVLGKKIPQCGIPKFTTRQRIIGGTVAGAGSHPWIAMLWSNKKKKLFCGGSLIAENWVLTAAHCLPGASLDLEDLRVKFGKTKAHREEPNEQTRRIVKIFKHPKFNSDTFDSDLALLKLDSPVVITDYVIPICLPYDDSDFTLLKTDAEGTVSGWGSKNIRQVNKGKFSKRLLEVKIPVADKTDCKSKMKHPVTANMFCAGAEGAGDACKGDSGGPFVIENKATRKHVLIGVVSWGEGCGRRNTFGVYVKLFNFLAWISSIAK